MLRYLLFTALFFVIACSPVHKYRSLPEVKGTVISGLSPLRMVLISLMEIIIKNSMKRIAWLLIQLFAGPKELMEIIGLAM